jgi:hypothetical protein
VVIPHHQRRDCRQQRPQLRLRPLLQVDSHIVVEDFLNRRWPERRLQPLSPRKALPRCQGGHRAPDAIGIQLITALQQEMEWHACVVGADLKPSLVLFHLSRLVIGLRRAIA